MMSAVARVIGQDLFATSHFKVGIEFNYNVAEFILTLQALIDARIGC